MTQVTITHLPVRIYAQMDWAIICLGNNLSPVQRQAITWINAGVVSIGVLGTNFNQIWIGVLLFSFKIIHLKRRPFCPSKLSEARHCVIELLKSALEMKFHPLLGLGGCRPKNAKLSWEYSLWMTIISNSVSHIWVIRDRQYLNQCWNIVNRTLRNEYQWNCNRNSNIFRQENACEKLLWKMAAILPRPQCDKGEYPDVGSNSIDYVSAGRLRWHSTKRNTNAKWCLFDFYLPRM